MHPSRLHRVPFPSAATSLAAVAGFGLACGSGNGNNMPPAEAVGNAPAAVANQVVARPAPGRAWVIFGSDTVDAEVASVPAQREQGLMDRDAVPDGTGMLFVFPESEHRSFWMRNTHVPLDIAFFDDSYRIMSIKQMEPLSETLTDSDAPTALVLEVRQGWFRERGIGPGWEAGVVFGPGLTLR